MFIKVVSTWTRMKGGWGKKERRNHQQNKKIKGMNINMKFGRKKEKLKKKKWKKNQQIG